jgi:hypothetical protein
MITRVFLTHVPEMLENYYGPRAVAALQEIAEVGFNPTDSCSRCGRAGKARGGVPDCGL